MKRASELGASLVEYALLLALVVIVAVVGLRYLGNSLDEDVRDNASTIDNAKP